jgi:hypothetical protein
MASLQNRRDYCGMGFERLRVRRLLGPQSNLSAVRARGRGLSRVDPAKLGLKRARSDIVGAPVKVLRAPWVRVAWERALGKRLVERNWVPC